jgi:hypothetical protein
MGADRMKPSKRCATGCWCATRRRIGLGDVSSAGLLCQWRLPSPCDFALPDVRTLSRLVEEPARRVVIKLGVTA